MPQTALVVRDAVEADVAALQAIYAHHVAHGTGSFETEAPDVAEMGRRWAGLVAQGYPYLVAEDAGGGGGGLAGFAYAGPFRPRAAFRFTVEDSLYVAPGRQGQGVGRALLAALIARCEAQGFRQMVAVIGDSANAGSIAVHASAGFVHTGTWRAVGFKFGRWVDTVFMQRALGPGDGTLPDGGAATGAP
ncbi:GNAT family N-acetyltransferase [Novispirillum sp. DQ9]|uniref:GNAT family N-acetyltransferase n=1 Tax=Novispirillum sp. DQ9 TaxID=3398612 RepID=UPI003C7E75B1